MSETQGRKRKHSSESHLEQELELLKTKFRLLEEQMKCRAANNDTEENNDREQALDARAPSRLSLDEGYTSSGAANPPKPLESVVKRIQENETHRQRNALYMPPKHAKDSKVDKNIHSPPSSPEGFKDNISRTKPPSPGPSQSRDTSLNPQTVTMHTYDVSKPEPSVTLVNNIQQLSIAQNLLYIPPTLPGNMRFKKISNNSPARPEVKEANVPNKCPSSPPTNHILPQMAERLCSVLQNGLPREERYRLQEKYKIPSNCTLMKAPCLNPEVIPFMDEIAKKRDSRMFKYQDQLGTSMAAIAEGVTLASRSDGDVRTAMEHINRGLHLLADLHSDHSRVRRFKCTPIDSRLKSFLVAKLSHRHHNFHDINHLFKRDDTVFGRDTGHLIKEFLRKE